MTYRLDTQDEVSVYEAGGVLQRFAQDFLASVGGIMSIIKLIVMSSYLSRRGGTSKGVFFNISDLPLQQCRKRADAFLLRVIGSLTLCKTY